MVVRITCRLSTAALMSLTLLFFKVPYIQAEPIVSDEIMQRFIDIGDYDIDALPCFLFIGLLEGEVDPNDYVSLSVNIDTMIRMHTRNIHNFSDQYDYGEIYDDVYEACYNLGVEQTILDVLDTIY